MVTAAEDKSCGRLGFRQDTSGMRAAFQGLPDDSIDGYAPHRCLCFLRQINHAGILTQQ
jgi:hypothetical protein